MTHQLHEEVEALVITEGIGDLVAMGWKPQPWKPGSPTTYVKGSKKLFKKGGSWYIDDKKLGRFSDKKLLAKLRTLHESIPDP